MVSRLSVTSAPQIEIPAVLRQRLKIISLYAHQKIKQGTRKYMKLAYF